MAPHGRQRPPAGILDEEFLVLSRLGGIIGLFRVLKPAETVSEDGFAAHAQQFLTLVAGDGLRHLVERGDVAASVAGENAQIQVVEDFVVRGVDGIVLDVEPVAGD